VRGNDQVAPIPDVPTLATERGVRLEAAIIDFRPFGDNRPGSMPVRPHAQPERSGTSSIKRVLAAPSTPDRSDRSLRHSEAGMRGTANRNTDVGGDE